MKPARILSAAGWCIVLILVLVGLTSLVGRSVSVTQHRGSSEATAMNDPTGLTKKYGDHLALTYAHLGGGFVMMLLGPWQFVPAIRRRWLRWHRVSGRLLVLGGLTAMSSGFVIGVVYPFPGFDHGFAERTAIAWISGWFLLSLTRAIWHVRRYEIDQHRVWMIRMFAMALAPAAERISLSICLVAGYSFSEVFGTTFWIAGALNAAAAEAWIRLTASPAWTKALYR